MEKPSQHDQDDDVDRGNPPAEDSPIRYGEEPPKKDRKEAVAGKGADDDDVADPERYKGGPGW